jgi:hypothetical protein
MNGGRILSKAYGTFDFSHYKTDMLLVPDPSKSRPNKEEWVVLDYSFH